MVQENRANGQGGNQEDQEEENQDQDDCQESQLQDTPNSQEKIQDDLIEMRVDKEQQVNLQLK